MRGALTVGGTGARVLGVRLPVMGTFVGLVLAILVAYRETALGMMYIWSRSETFNHCYLIAPITLWLVWQRRPELANMRAAPSAWALIPLSLSGAIWLIGSLARVDVLTHFALVGMLVVAVPCVFGFAITRRIAFPLAFMFLAVPFGEFAMPWMMDRTADFTVGALALSGVPVYREGLHFVIPSGNWSVVEACSGVRYLIASFTVGSLFGYLNYRSTRRRLAFMAVSIAVPIVANWIRAYLIVMLGHLTNNRLAAGVDHLVYGWLFFGVVIMIMFAIGSRFADHPGVTEAPQTRADRPTATLGIGGASVHVIATFLAIMMPALAQARFTAPTDLRPPTLSLGAAFGGWSSRVSGSGDVWKPAFESPRSEALARYGSQAGTVDVYLGYYRQQSDGSKVVGSGSVLVRSSDDGWVVSATGKTTARIAGRVEEVRYARISGTGRAGSSAAQRLLIWYFYWVDGHLTASEVEVKARTAWSMLNGRGDDAAVIVISTPADPGASERMQTFIDAAGANIVAEIARAGRR